VTLDEEWEEDDLPPGCVGCAGCLMLPVILAAAVLVLFVVLWFFPLAG
jgi:hypothetical protein